MQVNENLESLVRNIERVLPLADETCSVDVLVDQLFLVLAEYNSLLRLMLRVKHDFGLVGVDHPLTEDARRQAAAVFRQQAAKINTVQDQLAVFIDYCAGLLEGR